MDHEANTGLNDGTTIYRCSKIASDEKSAGFCLQAGKYCMLPKMGASAADFWKAASSQGVSTGWTDGNGHRQDCDKNPNGGPWTNVSVSFVTIAGILHTSVCPLYRAPYLSAGMSNRHATSFSHREQLGSRRPSVSTSTRLSRRRCPCCRSTTTRGRYQV